MNNNQYKNRKKRIIEIPKTIEQAQDGWIELPIQAFGQDAVNSLKAAMRNSAKNMDITPEELEFIIAMTLGEI